MIKLKTFRLEDWKYITKWISSEAELIQFSGQIFTFPISEKQVEFFGYIHFVSNFIQKLIDRFLVSNEIPTFVILSNNTIRKNEASLSNNKENT